MKILCVDDDPTILTVFKKALELSSVPHAEVLTAGTGESAIDMLMATDIDIVVVDLVLPGISGLDVLQRIKLHRPAAEVIVMTGYASVATAVEAMKAGARDYVSKPVSVAELIEKVLNVAEYVSRRREAEEYRFAKEAVEGSAQRDIASLEQALDAVGRCRDAVLKVLDGPDNDAGKLVQIRSLMSHHASESR